MTSPDQRQLNRRSGWLWSEPDYAELSKQTGASAPMLKSQFERAVPGMKSPLFIGQMMFMAGVAISWMGAPNRAESNSEVVIAGGMAAFVGILLVVLMSLGVLLMCAGILGLNGRINSRFWARIDGCLCPKCDATLAHLKANETGLVECPKCKNTYAETDVRPRASGAP